ncbi:hypothetical protein Leryth_004907 [Lithospermum erythrorhizon]|nr:hypothetical protein Leryth_004907 [Lithospermum erythrorhizon]
MTSSIRKLEEIVAQLRCLFEDCDTSYTRSKELMYSFNGDWRGLMLFKVCIVSLAHIPTHSLFLTLWLLSF